MRPSTRGKYNNIRPLLDNTTSHIVVEGIHNTYLAFQVYKRVRTLEEVQLQSRPLFNAIQYSLGKYSDSTFKWSGVVWRKRQARCLGTKECTTTGCNFVRPIQKLRSVCDVHNTPLTRFPCTSTIYHFICDLPEECLLIFGEHSHKEPPQHRISRSVRLLIERAVTQKPNITGLQLSLGELLPNKAAALCPSLANIDRLNELRRNCLSKVYGGPLDIYSIPRMFSLKENLVKKNYDEQQFKGMTVSYWLFPYLRNFVVTDSNTWIQTQSFFQSYLVPLVDCLVIDVKHDSNLHHFGICGFVPVMNKTVMLCRVQLNSLTADSYRMAFIQFLNTLMDDGIDINLLFDEISGILVDFSTAQYQGYKLALEEIFGENDLAESLIKGCHVHWLRSCKRIAKLICSPDKEEAFVNFCKTIPFEKDCESVTTIFKVIGITYPGARSWVDWWTRDSNIRLLSRAYSLVENWCDVPHTTNNVESLHNIMQLVHTKNVVVNSSTLFDIDERAFLEFRSILANVDLSYKSNNIDARLKRAEKRRTKRYFNDGRAPDTISQGIGRSKENWTGLQRFVDSVANVDESEDDSVPPTEQVDSVTDGHCSLSVTPVVSRKDRRRRPRPQRTDPVSPASTSPLSKLTRKE